MLQAQTWVRWLDTVPEFKCDPSKPFSQIIVPTADTVRYTYVVDALLAAGKHVLCVGDTGTGKTLTLMTKLLEHMPPEVQPVFMTFSARTSANQTQDIIGEGLGLRSGFVTSSRQSACAQCFKHTWRAVSPTCPITCTHKPPSPHTRGVRHHRVQDGQAPQGRVWATCRQALHHHGR